jgi:hypothetical protein
VRSQFRSHYFNNSLCWRLPACETQRTQTHNYEYAMGVTLLLAVASATSATTATRAHRILVDRSDAPKIVAHTSMWERRSRSPFGSVVFSLRAEDGSQLSRAVVYASLGLPSELLEEKHRALLSGSPCTWELMDIDTPELYRRQGHASVLTRGIISWLKANFAETPALYARDVSGIAGLYSCWGFAADDPEFDHVYVRSTLD